MFGLKCNSSPWIRWQTLMENIICRNVNKIFGKQFYYTKNKKEIVVNIINKLFFLQIVKQNEKQQKAKHC